MSMVFCGNCGYRLSAGDQVCPQCGTPADPDLLPTQENPDQPTMASNSLYPPEDAPTQVKMQPPQEPLILAPQDASEPDAPTRAVQRPSASQPGYGVQPGRYPPASPLPSRTSYPNYPPVGYPGVAPQAAYPTTPAGYDPAAEAARRTGHTGRIVGLIFILLGLLLIIAAMAVFLFTHHTTNTPTPAQQAQALIQQYYDDINQHHYQAAYALLSSSFQQSQPYNNFTSGYSHTLHDDITFDSITEQADGTVKVDITIHASESPASGKGTQNSTYKGSYSVGQENGSWKILSGTFQKV